MDYDKLLVMVSELGYAMMVSGAEIYRVEESAYRLLEAYGVDGPEVFAIPNCLIVSCVTPEGESKTRMRRVGSHGTDLDKLDRYNALCRRVCASPMPVEEVNAALAEIGGRPSYRPWQICLAYFTAALAFTFFFRGNAMDALCSGICGMAIWAASWGMETLHTNQFLKNVGASALSALLAVFLVWLGLGVNLDSIIIGAFMTLTPGIAITNAVRGMIGGDLITGLTRLAEVLTVALAIALGTGIAIGLAQFIGG